MSFVQISANIGKKYSNKIAKHRANIKKLFQMNKTKIVL